MFEFRGEKYPIPVVTQKLSDIVENVTEKSSPEDFQINSSAETPKDQIVKVSIQLGGICIWDTASYKDTMTRYLKKDGLWLLDEINALSTERVIIIHSEVLDYFTEKEIKALIWMEFYYYEYIQHKSTEEAHISSALSAAACDGVTALDVYNAVIRKLVASYELLHQYCPKIAASFGNKETFVRNQLCDEALSRKLNALKAKM